MKKLPPNAKRVIVNGNPYIEHTDPTTGKIRLEDDYGTKLAKLPVNQQIARRRSPKTRFAKRGEISNA